MKYRGIDMTDPSQRDDTFYAVALRSLPWFAAAAAACVRFGALSFAAASSLALVLWLASSGVRSARLVRGAVRQILETDTIRVTWPAAQIMRDGAEYFLLGSDNALIDVLRDDELITRRHTGATARIRVPAFDDNVEQFLKLADLDDLSVVVTMQAGSGVRMDGGVLTRSGLGAVGPYGVTGSRAGFKFQCPKGRVGSNPTRGTKTFNHHHTTNLQRNQNND